MPKKHRKPKPSPSLNGLSRPPPAEGRDVASGRFSAGNKLGVGGSPLAAHGQRIRSAIARRLTTEIAGKIVDVWIAKALKGDLKSGRELFNRILGKARPADQREPLQILIASEEILADTIDSHRKLRIAQATGSALDLVPSDDARVRATEVVNIDPVADRRRVRAEVKAFREGGAQ